MEPWPARRGGGAVRPYATAAVRRTAAVGVLLVVGLLALARGTSAQDMPPPDPREAQPERPSVATHAFTVAPGILEIEVGLQTRPLLDAPGLVKIGLARDLQLDIAPAWLANNASTQARSGFTDTSIGVKWHVADRVPGLSSIAVQPSVTLATGSEQDGLGAGDTALNLLFISSRKIKGVSLDLNVGATFRHQTEAAPSSATVWAAAAGIPVSDRWGWVAEVFGYPGTSGAAGEPPTVGLLTGPTFGISKRLVVDAGVIASIEGFGRTAIYSGATWNVARIWAPK